MNFYGYKRPDGRVGVRNKVLILPASVCASDTTRIISQQVVGSVTFNNQLGCSQVAPDQQFTMDVMAGYAANPNVYGTVVVSLGCENCQMDLVVKAIQERTNKPLKQVIIQEAGGTLKAIDMAVRYAKEMVEGASLLQKEEFPMSELIIGTECGGSDPTSGLAANPLIGQLSDLIVKEGGTSILSETTEFIGAEIVVFSTGRGTPTGNPLAPVIKITGNKLTYANMIDNIDVDASPLIYGTKTIEELGQELLKLTQEVACGKQTKAESLGYTEMAIARVCNFV